jgi:hypothetical protein
MYFTIILTITTGLILLGLIWLTDTLLNIQKHRQGGKPQTYCKWSAWRTYPCFNILGKETKPFTQLGAAVNQHRRQRPAQIVCKRDTIARFLRRNTKTASYFPRSRWPHLCSCAQPPSCWV